MTIAWWVDRPFLSMACVGSIPSMIRFFLCEKSSKVLDLCIGRGEGRAPEIIVTKSATFMNSETNIFLVALYNQQSALQKKLQRVS